MATFWLEERDRGEQRLSSCQQVSVDDVSTADDVEITPNVENATRNTGHLSPNEGNILPKDGNTSPCDENTSLINEKTSTNSRETSSDNANALPDGRRTSRNDENTAPNDGRRLLTLKTVSPSESVVLGAQRKVGGTSRRANGHANKQEIAG